MSILALRKNSPATKIIAYQHASISLRHTNFFLAKEESRFTPMPDVIITMGEVTRDILKNKGNFPEHLLRVGCALRQRVTNKDMCFECYCWRRENKKFYICPLVLAIRSNDIWYNKTKKEYSRR